MGQPIEVIGTVRLDDVIMIDTDRSITGQDGTAYTDAEEAAASGIFPGALAERLFTTVDGVDHVFVASNQVVVRRPEGWDDATVEKATAIVTDFFLYYPDA